MNRRSMTGPMMAIALLLGLALTGCGSDAPAQPKPTATTDTAAAEKTAVLEAFDRYWDEHIAIGTAGKVPKDALETTAIGAVREHDIAQFTQDADHGTTRKGTPDFKDEMVTFQGETALVTACVKWDDWVFVLKDGSEMSGGHGWIKLARQLTKVDGTWLVSDYVPQKGTCG